MEKKLGSGRISGWTMHKFPRLFSTSLDTGRTLSQVGV